MEKTDAVDQVTGCKAINRATGLLILEVVNSNPNGDPDNESEPRVRPGNLGEISPVSFKRKLRDLVDEKDGPAWKHAASLFAPELEPANFDILENPKRELAKLLKMETSEITRRFWDARLFGCTLLEEKEKKEDKKEGKKHIVTGVVQFGMGLSIAPVEIQRQTWTNKSPVQEGKSRGMAPLGYRVVQHGVYVMPFFVNPTLAPKSGCTRIDLDLMLAVMPYAYSHTASCIRPDVRIRHAWYIEHKSPLGSCPDFLLLEALSPKPKKKGDPAEPSHSWDDYDDPGALPKDLRDRVADCRDLVNISAAAGK